METGNREKQTTEIIFKYTQNVVVINHKWTCDIAAKITQIVIDYNIVLGIFEDNSC